MTPNSIHPPLTGSADGQDEGFARRRVNDIAGLAAIVATILVVALVVGVDTPLFAVGMFAALGALVFGEQRMRAASPHHTSQHGAFTGRHVRA
jgi:hypothetical protein